MEKNIEYTLLYDIYGKLLTEKQQNIFEQYYLYNLSLREISKNLDITYQAVRDSIKSSEKMLNNFENVVGMCKIQLRLKKIEESIEKYDANNLKAEILSILDEK